ncbi:MAG: IS607 family transposase [Zestosphaera tikiterensis]|uniref:IS607 family transposase n=1 Tax=Zestosphaera tikiterensis TaxID=1973259 RepID=A0A2R7Y4B9_9CREN|nr:MAG: IS607 family transposase [Zestosphaera tikiterensis]
MKEASEILGVHVRTLQKWDREGKIRCVRTVGGKRRVPESEIKRILGLHEERKVVGYVRVSSHTQRDDLERQIEAINQYAKERGWSIEILKDIGSGLNEDRRGFQKLLKMVINREVSKVIIAYPDRLARFGFKILQQFFQSYGTEIIVINREEKELKEELVEDLITIISHFAGKLYGMRSHKYREVVKSAKQLLQDS